MTTQAKDYNLINYLCWNQISNMLQIGTRASNNGARKIAVHLMTLFSLKKFIKLLKRTKCFKNMEAINCMIQGMGSCANKARKNGSMQSLRDCALPE